MMHGGIQIPPIPQIMNRPTNEVNSDRAPTTTVFVGNLSDRVPDPMIYKMLQRCGLVITWKRAQGANGKLQAFGFCEYDQPEATLRCIRLLNDYEIAGKKIVVKVDEKTKVLLIDYKKKKRRETEANKLRKPTLSSTQQQLMRFNLTKRKYGDLNENKEEEEQEQQNKLKKLDDLQVSLDSVDEESLKEDRMALNAFESIVKQYAKDLLPPTPPTTATQQQIPTNNQITISAPPVINNTQLVNSNNEDSNGDNSGENNSIYMKPHLRLEEIQLDADKKEIITSEIQLFREKHKGEDVKIKREEKIRMERVSEREKREKRSKSRDRDSNRRERRNRSNSRSPPKQVTTRSPPPPRNYNRPPRVIERDNRLSPPIQSTNIDDLNELNERKRLERKLREKEAAYRERLKQWESREDKRARQYEIEKKNEINKRKDRLKEIKKIKQILEDYDDDKDDENYYKGTNFAKKLKFREKEIEMDNRDRQREKEEIDLLKEKIVNQGGSLSDLEAEIRKVIYFPILFIHSLIIFNF
jgi:RNA-binding protein 25